MNAAFKELQVQERAAADKLAVLGAPEDVAKLRFGGCDRVAA